MSTHRLSRIGQVCGRASCLNEVFLVCRALCRHAREGEWRGAAGRTMELGRSGRTMMTSVEVSLTRRVAAAPTKDCCAEICNEESDMMMDWNEYRKQLAFGVKEISQLSPDTIKGYIELNSAGQKRNLLGAKTRELIALAVAVTLRCDGCITVHTEAAIKQGASKDEIAEALGVATTVNAGAALVYSARVMEAFKEYPRAAPSQQ